MSEKLLTVADVAEYLVISRTAVYQLVKEARLTSLRVMGGQKGIRFHRADVEKYLASCERGEPAAEPPTATKRRRRRSSAKPASAVPLEFLEFDPKARPD